MNCFNIREIQSILKRRFFTDLINTHDHHVLLDRTAMGLRFKTNNINTLNNNSNLFYNYGIEFSPKIRTVLYNTNTEFSETIPSNNLFFLSIVKFFENIQIFAPLNKLYLSYFPYFQEPLFKSFSNVFSAPAAFFANPYTFVVTNVESAIADAKAITFHL
jgi:hypothetical protein